ETAALVVMILSARANKSPTAELPHPHTH
ncbi:hypothetical protein, partial [Klebsiella pneumoniae]